MEEDLCLFVLGVYQFSLNKTRALDEREGKDEHDGVDDGLGE